MRFSTVSEWMNWMSKLHFTEMELGLARIRVVAERLSILHPTCPVIIVGGTNGKGSTVAGLEAIYRSAFYQVGAFTSPMLFKPNEQIRISGREVSDDELCQAFEKVAAALQEMTLTTFEFFTLAAMVIFKQHQLDIWILEVGLGGKLDAVNIIDADVSVVTTVAMDHMEWLGDTREKIGYEKAGIFRSGKPAICGDTHPPQTLVDYANDIKAMLFCQEKDFRYIDNQYNWEWVCGDIHYRNLPFNTLARQNMSTALMAISCLQSRLPVTVAAIKQGLAKAFVPGRIQIIPDDSVMQIWDVSHNPASVALLTKKLNELPKAGKVRAVFSMLADKDILTSIRGIQACIDTWYVAPLTTPRGATIEQLVEAFKQAEIEKVVFFQTVQVAYQQALNDACEGDKVVVFGSFHTVSQIYYYSR